MSLLTKIPPPLALAVSLGAAALLTWRVPALQTVWFCSPMAAGLVAGGSVAWIVWAGFEFRRYRTTILPHRQPTSLLCAGPFCLSRNPLYLAMLLLSATPWLCWGSLGLLLAPLGFFAFINTVIVPHEEMTLRELFGDKYADYCRRVRRWV